MILKQLLKYDNAHAIEATWVNENDVVIKCQAYSNAQMDMLRTDLGGDAAAYETLISEVEATYTPPPLPEPVVPAIYTTAQGLVALYAVKGSPKRM